MWRLTVTHSSSLALESEPRLPVTQSFRKRRESVKGALVCRLKPSINECPVTDWPWQLPTKRKRLEANGELAIKQSHAVPSRGQFKSTMRASRNIRRTLILPTISMSSLVVSSPVSVSSNVFITRLECMRRRDVLRRPYAND